MNGTYRQEYTSNVYTDYNIDFGESYIKVNNMLRYSFPLNNFRIFINGGISNGISISETNFVREERNQLGDVTIYEYKALERTRKHEMAFFAGFGLKYNRFSLETRYERGNGMSLYNSLLSETARYYVIIGFLFNSPK